MSTLINDPACNVVIPGNTGLPDCDTKMAKPEQIIAIPRNHVFSVANVATFHTVLQAMCLAALGQRAYPFPLNSEIKDDSEEETESKSGFGDIAITNEGKYRWTFLMKENVGEGLWKKILTYKNSNAFDLLVIDSNGNVFGKMGPTAGTFMGKSASLIYPKNMKVANGTDGTQYNLKIVFDDPRDFNENSAFIVPIVSLKNYVKGNIDVILTEGGVAASETFKICAKEAISGINLYPAFQDLLAVVGAWVVTKDGVNCPITSVTKSAVFSGWTIVCTSGATSGTIHVSLATPAALAALTLPVGGPPDEGFESNSVACVIP